MRLSKIVVDFIIDKLDRMFGEYDNMYDLCYPEQGKQQHSAPQYHPPRIEIHYSEINQFDMLVDYLDSIKPFCRSGAEYDKWHYNHHEK